MKNDILKLESEIKRKYPFVKKIDGEILKYIGILSPTPLEEEKLLLKKIVEERWAQ